MNPEIQPHAIIHAEIVVDDESDKKLSRRKITLVNDVLLS
jgi:hypothetical protein